MANATVSGGGAYSYPTYASAFAQSPDGFQRFLQEVWNTVSGVADLVLVAWSPVIAAGAYLAGAVEGALTSVSHGLEELAKQTSVALDDVEKAMEWAWRAPR